jgi:hypothetical protein
MGKVLDVPMMGVIGLGAILPFLGAAVYDKVAGAMPSQVELALSGNYVKPAVLATTSLGIIYLASKYSNMISTQTAVMAGTISTAIFVGAALKRANVLEKIPIVGNYLNQFSAGDALGSSYMGGYSGGYLGYLGNEHSGMGMDQGNLYGDAPAMETQLFGNVGSSPQVNIF